MASESEKKSTKIASPLALGFWTFFTCGASYLTTELLLWDELGHWENPYFRLHYFRIQTGRRALEEAILSFLSTRCLLFAVLSTVLVLALCWWKEFFRLKSPELKVGLLFSCSLYFLYTRLFLPTNTDWLQQHWGLPSLFFALLIFHTSLIVLLYYLWEGRQLLAIFLCIMSLAVCIYASGKSLDRLINSPDGIIATKFRLEDCRSASTKPEACDRAYVRELKYLSQRKQHREDLSVTSYLSVTSCGMLLSAEHKDICLSAMAQLLSNPQYCRALFDEEKRDRCLIENGGVRKLICSYLSKRPGNGLCGDDWRPTAENNELYRERVPLALWLRCEVVQEPGSCGRIAELLEEANPETNASEIQKFRVKEAKL